jgi:Tripartite tricarboxylate transporter family receptor
MPQEGASRGALRTKLIDAARRLSKSALSLQVRAGRRDPIALGIGTINTLNHEINAVLGDPKVKERFADIGGIPLGGSPADFRTLITDEIAKWGKVIQVANINP